MSSKGLLKRTKRIFTALIPSLAFLATSVHASFIESTIGTAVVNDATATYHNPAALTVLKNSQIVTLGSIADFNSRFTGQSVQLITGFTQIGNSTVQTRYFLPSFYFGMPISNKVTLGFGIVYNNFFNDLSDNSILRYVQSNNHIQNIDFIPAFGIKINDFFALGAGLNFTYVNILLQPISGFPSLNVPDSESRNEANGRSLGGHIGFLLNPTRSTVMGFNYRTAVTYQLNGNSRLEDAQLTANDYHFNIWTPARSVFSINQFVTPTLGLIGTIQYIKWSMFKEINLHNVATKIASLPTILPSVKVRYHLHNTWLLTLGSHFHITPEWIIRVAGSYVQSPSNPHYQISNGDNVILGASMSYDIYKFLTLDCGYSHTFIRNQSINIVSNTNIIDGVSKGFRNAFSLKLTLNFL